MYMYSMYSLTMTETLILLSDWKQLQILKRSHTISNNQRFKKMPDSTTTG